MMCSGVSGEPSRLHRRIVGGTLAQAHDLPLVVQVVTRDSHANLTRTCSGFFVDSTHVLTAAHCVQDGAKKPLLPNHIFIRGSQQASSTELQRVQSVHPYFVSNYVNDITILRLQSPYTLEARPPQTFSRSRPTPGKVLRVGGWGLQTKTPSIDEKRTYEDDRLQYADFEVIPCRLPFKMSQRSMDYFLLCTPANPERRINIGDSGGPIVSFHNGQWVIHGMVLLYYQPSINQITPLATGWVAVFARLEPYMHWIQSITHQSAEALTGTAGEFSDPIEYMDYLHTAAATSHIWSVRILGLSVLLSLHLI
ncbi:Chymotrypsin-like elastase member 1 [Dimargaris verticillata]|uniref:Chymotrypsin-like elastase member 1 n=1 Tax=Dimargaris verticillata TaxID=2761393 RepID=A0A9W8BBY8_9FUNG|nr:Chymotrypsin-like elastase member 1 [Dimargaris verticillata]